MRVRSWDADIELRQHAVGVDVGDGMREVNALVAVVIVQYIACTTQSCQ